MRQLDEASAGVEVIVANDEHPALLEPADPPNDGRGRDFGPVADVPDGITALQHIGFEEVEEDIPGGAREIFGAKHLSPKVAEPSSPSHTMLQSDAARRAVGRRDQLAVNRSGLIMPASILHIHHTISDEFGE
jgi:hypothetical protein